MTHLTKLKIDRDTCYGYACAAYGKEFIDAQMYEPNEDDEQTLNGIVDIRKVCTPIIECSWEENLK